MTQRSKSPIRTIFAPIDFSTASIRALDWAESVAKAQGARLVLFHALAPPVGPMTAPEFVPVPPELYKLAEEQSRSLLNEHVEQRRASGVAVEARMEPGPAAQTIVDTAEEEEADLLVVGTRGQTGLKRAFLGSVAAHVIREAPCPVLSVPPEAEAEPRPIRNVLVPTDFSSEADRAALEAVRLLSPTPDPMRVTLLHVWRVPLLYTPLGAFPMDEFTRSAMVAAQERLEEAAAKLRADGIEVSIDAREGDPATEIDEAARRLPADVVAMGTHGRSGLSRAFLGSVAERTLPGAPCPVLTVKGA